MSYEDCDHPSIGHNDGPCCAVCSIAAERDEARAESAKHREMGIALVRQLAEARTAMDEMMNDTNRPHAALLRDVERLRAERDALRAQGEAACIRIAAMPADCQCGNVDAANVLEILAVLAGPQT